MNELFPINMSEIKFEQIFENGSIHTHLKRQTDC